MKKRNLKNLSLNKKSISKLALTTHGGNIEARSKPRTVCLTCDEELCEDLDWE